MPVQRIVANVKTIGDRSGGGRGAGPGAIYDVRRSFIFSQLPAHYETLFLTNKQLSKTELNNTDVVLKITLNCEGLDA